MKKLFLPVLVVAGVGVWFFGGRLFASMPVMQFSGSHVLVGKAAGDHALYAMNGVCEIRAASVGYSFNSMGMGSVLPKLGARGVVSFMDGKAYQALEAASCRTGTCMANYLNESLRKGEIQHLILVPGNAAALGEMRKASIGDGKGFRLKGRYLAYQEGTVDGHAFHGEIAGTGYFLVESIAGE